MHDAHSYSYFTVRDSIVEELLNAPELDNQTLIDIFYKIKAMTSFYNLDYLYEKYIIVSKYYKLDNKPDDAKYWRKLASERWSETQGITKKIPLTERLI